MAANIDTLHTDLEAIKEAITKLSGQGSSTPGASPPKNVKQQLAESAGQLMRNTQKPTGWMAQGQQLLQAGQRAQGTVAQAQGMMSMQSLGTMAVGKAGPWGVALVAIKEVATALFTLPSKIKDFADGLHQANMQFASVSPSMALVQMQSNFQEMMRNMAKGEALAASAGGLAEQRGRLADALAPAETAYQNLQNRIGEAASATVANFLEKSEWGKQLASGIDHLTTAFEDYTEWLNGEQNQKKADDWVDEMHELERDERAKIGQRMQPVRHIPGRDPRPNFAHDRRDPGGF